MKFWIEKDDTIFLYQLLKAAGLEDDYPIIRQIVRKGEVSVNDQVTLSQRHEIRVGDTVRYNSIHVKILENRSEEREGQVAKSSGKDVFPQESIRHGSTKKWSSKPLKEDQKLDDKINEFCIQLHKTFISKKLTLSLAESCTGGMAQEKITSMPGASEFFPGGVITYSNHIKEKLLKVKKKTIQDNGAVSKQTADEMAAGVQTLLNSDVSASVTGIAGPSGGTAEKPVGCVFISVKTQSDLISKKFIFSGSREKIRKKSVLELFKIILENI
jgi:PncC family amidohydrolase